MEGGNLWDDSALINAFDDAMSNYKVEHLSLSLYKVLCFLLQLS
jgi:hypothetical protein